MQESLRNNTKLKRINKRGKKRIVKIPDEPKLNMFISDRAACILAGINFLTASIIRNSTKHINSGQSYETIFNAIFWSLLPMWYGVKCKRYVLAILGMIATAGVGIFTGLFAGMLSAFVGYIISDYITTKHHNEAESNRGQSC